MGLGGDGGVGGGTLIFLIFLLPDFFPLALRKMGASLSSSLAGGEDRADDSESDMLFWLLSVHAEMDEAVRKVFKERARALATADPRHSPDF